MSQWSAEAEVEGGRADGCGGLDGGVPDGKGGRHERWLRRRRRQVRRGSED